MNKEIVKKWELNKKRLEKHFKKNAEFFGSWECQYEDVVKAVVKVIVNDDEDDFDTNLMTVIDHGDYQGAQLFIVPRDTYHPSPKDYLVTYEYYGSCSGCDTLQAIQSENDEKHLVSDLMELSLHLIQNMKFIYGEDD